MTAAGGAGAALEATLLAAIVRPCFAGSDVLGVCGTDFAMLLARQLERES